MSTVCPICKTDNVKEARVDLNKINYFDINEIHIFLIQCTITLYKFIKAE
jgi:hypothetical protein